MRLPPLNYQFKLESGSNLSELQRAALKINKIWEEEIVNPQITLKSNSDLERFLLRLKNEVSINNIKVDRLRGATTALILKVHDIFSDQRLIIKLPFVHKNYPETTLKYLAGIDVEKRNLDEIRKLSQTELIHSGYWQQASNAAPSLEHTINSDYIEHDSNLVRLLFGADSLSVSMINPIKSVKTIPINELADHLESFLRENRLPIFADLDVYNIFQDVIKLAARGVQLVDAGGLQNTLVKKNDEKYKPIIIDLDPHLKSSANLYQLLFSDNYKEQISQMMKRPLIEQNPYLQLIQDYSQKLTEEKFIKIRNIAAALDFMLTKLPMFEMSRGQGLRDSIIDQVDQKLNPDANKHILNLRLQCEIQVRRVIRRSLENNCFKQTDLKNAVDYLTDINQITNNITERGVKVLSSLKAL